MEDFFVYLIIAAISIATLAYVQKSSTNKKAKMEFGRAVLRLHPIYFWASIVLTLMAIGFLGVMIYYSDEINAPSFLLLLAPLLMFALSGIYLLLLSKNHLVQFDGTKIDVTNFRGNQDSIWWNELEKIKFNALSGFIIFKGKDKKVKVHQHLVGLSSLFEEMEFKTNLKAKDLKLPFKVKR